MATLGLITVAYSNGSPLTAEVDSSSTLTVDGPKTASGGDRPATPFTGFREFYTGDANCLIVPSTEIAGLSLSGNTFTVSQSGANGYSGATTLPSIPLPC